MRGGFEECAMLQGVVLVKALSRREGREHMMFCWRENCVEKFWPGGRGWSGKLVSPSGEELPRI
jgi:hypothetical protein